MSYSSEFWKTLWDSIPEIRDFNDEAIQDKLPDSVRSQVRAFLSILSGSDMPQSINPTFLERAAHTVVNEWLLPESSELRKKAADLSSDGLISSNGLLELFFPEYKYGGTQIDEKIDFIRNKRAITIESLNPTPIENPSIEMVFTSNVLLTLPPEKYKKRLGKDLQTKVSIIEMEEQKFWFDHPILMGVTKEANEMIYGLKGLADAFDFEKKSGVVPADSRMTVILSLSVTHDGLKSIAHEYLSNELNDCDGLDDLDIFLFTEEDTKDLSEILMITAGMSDCLADLQSVFGVDGRYGRHYSFLKAIIPLWSLVVNPEVKGTFKIDLDQVFPQKELKLQTGKTAFEHFMTPLWGALGTDFYGRKVELGMIAGALVNEKDIQKSIFEPDVPLPKQGIELKGENRVFFKQLPMAVSTIAEMMIPYIEGTDMDGINRCLSRVHVTGGTNGILCSTLRQKKPFTPSFIGRAEDQAYLLSVLKNEEPVMRYVHDPGLIMRHDKEAFAGDAIEAAKIGTWVADLLRILYFSYYASFLPGGLESVKEEMDPFTGCFISFTPMIKIFLRLILKLLESPSESEILLELAEIQLLPFLTGEENSETVKVKWLQERDAWKSYYDALDFLEKGISDKNNITLTGASKLRERLQVTRIK